MGSIGYKWDYPASVPEDDGDVCLHPFFSVQQGRHGPSPLQHLSHKLIRYLPVGFACLLTTSCFVTEVRPKQFAS